MVLEREEKFCALAPTGVLGTVTTSKTASRRSTTRRQRSNSESRTSDAVVLLDDTICEAFVGFVLLALRAGYSLVFGYRPPGLPSGARAMPDGRRETYLLRNPTAATGPTSPLLVM